MTLTPRSRLLALASAWLATAAWAQPSTPSPTPPSNPPAAAPAAAAPGATAGQTVEISGGRQSDTEQRRQSTAAKIVIGREEIDRFGDSSLGEVLRRLPGVTVPGAPGRGGPPRMRGLGAGYTQLLIDGQRVPPGFSFDQLSPEQVERIEILRAPTAETGARAIAGTINIITREGFRRRLNDLRLGMGVENGEVSPGVFWTHNDSAGPLTYNLSASVFRRRQASDSVTDLLREDGQSGEDLRVQQETQQSLERRLGLSLSSRLQWRLGESGDVLVLAPTLFRMRSQTARAFDLVQPLAVPPAPTLYDSGTSDTEGSFTNLRLNTQWRQRLAGGTRFELGGVLGRWQSFNDTDRIELRDGVAEPLRTREDVTRTNERMVNLTAKWSRLVGGSAQRAGGEHNLVGGLELEGVRRTETRSTLLTGASGSVSDESDAADNLQATSVRLAAYAQDEWQLSANWAAHVGLRWEGITTRGTSDDGRRPENVSRVLTPLLHAVWKPDPKARDQVRVSLTRSYRSPPLGSLIGRRTTSSRFPVEGPNERLYPDRIGNPDLRPELATGIDLAVERYLSGGGVLSANVFHRRIKDLIRSETTLQTVDWSPAQRWVSQPVNIGDATSQGLELEAKFRLDQLVGGAPRIELRNNLSLFRSRVDDIPGPDNRLDGQARATGNFGADYRMRSIPLTLGGSLNWVPAYRTQQSAEQAVSVSTKRVFDAFALWTFSPAVGLRLLASNLTPRDYVTTTVADSVDLTGRAVRDTSVGTNPSDINWQLRLELKL